MNITQIRIAYGIGVLLQDASFQGVLRPQKLYGLLVTGYSMCLTSTETVRLIRDGEKGGKGVWRVTVCTFGGVYIPHMYSYAM